MRVAFVLSSSHIGGGETNLLDFLARSDRSNFEWAVVTLGGPGEVNDRVKKIHVRDARYSGTTASKIWRLTNFFRTWQPDVVHLYGMKSNLLARPLGLPFGNKTVSAVIGANPSRPLLHTILDRATAPLVDRWLCNSEAGRDAVVNTLRVPPSRTRIVYQGIDTRRFTRTVDATSAKKALGIEPATNVVVTIANLRPMKMHASIVRSVPAITAAVAGTVFLFVGRDDMQGAVQKVARDLGVGEAVKFIGPRDDVVPYLAAADIFLLPSLHEGLPTAIIEAMSMSVPVVASRVGGIPEIVRDQETGLLIAPDNIDAIAAAVTRLLLDPQLARALGARGRQRVLDQFAVERMVTALQREYTSMMPSRAGAP
ncbi:MAG: glycosyltransferase [Chloroflexota bacterium]